MERWGQVGVRALVTTLVVSVCAASPARSSAAAAANQPHRKDTVGSSRAAQLYDQMSAMGALAAGVTPANARPVGPPTLKSGSTVAPQAASDVLVNGLSAPLTQSETSLAANATGVMIAGFNDARGFPAPGDADQQTLSMSGLARSTDGGDTWSAVNVGPARAPSTLPTITNGSVFGDPSVVWVPSSGVFVYASIYVRPSDRLQGMMISVSNADGTSWSTPIEVTPSFISQHSADKEWLTVNPVTGRLLLTWTDFGTSTVMKSAYSDNLGTTWSAAASLATAAAGAGIQASVPAFLPAATNSTSTAYVVWRTIDASGNRNIAGVRSTDGGATWSTAVSLDNVSYPAEDQIVGVDRVNNSPALAIDNSSGRVYVVYQRNSSNGTGDIALRTFTGAVAAGNPVSLSVNPGNDRAQFYPWVTVDQSTQRVHIGWMDQAPAASGDLVDVMHTFSDDQAATWAPPTPINARPFHAGFGNDTGQPNLGDYNGAVVVGGTLHTLWGGTSVEPQFNEGLPTGGLISPDVYYGRVLASEHHVPLRPAGPSFVESAAPNGHLDPGETANVSVPLVNYVTNASVGAQTLSNVTATLSSQTAGITVGSPNASYPNIAAGATQSSATPYSITLDSGFVPGTPIDLQLNVAADQGNASLVFRFETGTPGTPTTLLSEDFESVTVPSLPAGWTSNIGGGSAPPAWASDATFMNSKAAFHTETGTATNFVRLFSPQVAVPSQTVQSYVTLDFDLRYNLEDEPLNKVLAYDGLTLRLTDSTGGTVLRSVLAEAFAQSLTTAGVEGFPKHLPRSNDAAYFQDMAVWSGESNGVKHVFMRFPGAGLAGRTVQLRFEYTQDSTGICLTGTCGVGIDNVVLRQVPIPVATATSTTLTAAPPGPITQGDSVTLTADVSPSNAPGSVEFFDGQTSLGSQPINGGTAALGAFAPTTGGHSFTAVFTPTDATAYSGSTSAALPYTVNKIATTTSLSADPPSQSSYGAPVTLTAQVTPGVAGSVEFFDGQSSLGAVPVSGGTASLDPISPTAGDHSYTAAFTPTNSTDYASSSSAPLPYQVAKAIVFVSLSTTPEGPLKLGSPVQLVAQLSSIAPGSVEFFDSGHPLGTYQTDSDVATTPSLVLGEGLHDLTATYTPDDQSSYVGSTSDLLTLVVDGTAPTVTLKAPTATTTLAGSVTVAWNGSDALTGVDHYAVSTRKAPWNGGFSSWSTPSAWSSLAGTSLKASIATGTTACFRVMAVDGVGNTSPWSATRCITRPLDDRALTASAGWKRGTGSSYYLNTITSTTKLGATLKRTGAAFDRVGIVATRCPGCGTVGVYRGSTLLGKISLANSTTTKKAILLLPKLASVTTGAITLKVLSSGKTVQIDGLLLARSR